MSEAVARRNVNDEVNRLQMIARYIERDPLYPDESHARVIGHGVSVSAIVTALLDAGGDMYVVIEEYGLPHDAIRAAIWCYDLHKAIIDARMTLDEAAFLDSPTLIAA